MCIHVCVHRWRMCVHVYFETMRQCLLFFFRGHSTWFWWCLSVTWRMPNSTRWYPRYFPISSSGLQVCNTILHLVFSFIDNKKKQVLFIRYILNRVSPSCQLVPGNLSFGSEWKQRKQRTGEDVIEWGAISQPQKAAKLGSFGHIVLALDEGYKKEVMESPSVTKESCWGQAQGCHCMEA